MADGAVDSLLVVDRDPLFADDANLIEALELIGVEHFDAECPVEPFDVGVLCRAPGLGELPLDAVGLGPRLHDATAKLWTIVTAHRIGFAVPLAQLLQHANDSFA